MIQTRSKISEFGSNELIQMARQAIICNATDEKNFKRRIMAKDEVEKAKTCDDKKELAEMFLEIKERYEDWLFEAHDNGKT